MLRHLLEMIDASLQAGLISRLLRLEPAKCTVCPPPSESSEEESDAETKAECPHIFWNSSVVQGQLVRYSEPVAGASPPWISEPISNQTFVSTS